MPAMAQTVDDTGTLPNAKPGECYAKVVIPAQYKTENVDVTAREASVRFEMVPAKYEVVEEKVLVKEAAKKIVPVPAEYETTTETVELAAASTVWLSGRKRNSLPASPVLLAAIGNGGIKLDEQPVGACLSEYFVPAQYKDEDVRVLKTASYENIEVEPAAYEWVEEKVLVKEATKEVVEVPAVFETVTEKVLVSPATTMWKAGRGPVQRIDNSTGEIMCLVEVPAKYKSVTRKVIKSRSHDERGGDPRGICRAAREQTGQAGPGKTHQGGADLRDGQQESPGCRAEVLLASGLGRQAGWKADR